MFVRPSSLAFLMSATWIISMKRFPERCTFKLIFTRCREAHLRLLFDVRRRSCCQLLYSLYAGRIAYAFADTALCKGDFWTGNPQIRRFRYRSASDMMLAEHPWPSPVLRIDTISARFPVIRDECLSQGSWNI